MRSVPVNPDLTFIGTGKAAARAEFAVLSDGSRKRTGNQDSNADGVPMWVVDVLYLAEDSDRAEVCGVKVASFDPPTTQVGQPVKFANLVAVPWVDDARRVQMSFRADGIVNDAGHKPNEKAA